MKPNVGFLPHGLKVIAGAACKLGLSPYLITGLSSAASQIYTDYPCVHWDPGGWLLPQRGAVHGYRHCRVQEAQSRSRAPPAFPFNHH